jgi:hypothetical protein
VSAQTPEQRRIDEEIFGEVVTNDSTGWWASLSPSGNLPAGASDTLPVDHTASRDWGWYDVTGDGGCTPGVASGEEVHKLPNGQLTHDSVVGTDTLETHCVETGTSFRLELWRRDTRQRSDSLQFRREIDWVAWSRVYVGNNSLWIDDTIGSGASFQDLWAYFDQTGGADTVAPVVQLTATLTATEASWNPLTPSGDGSFHIPTNFVVRLGAWPTTTSADDIRKVLVRYFWSYSSVTPRTGFVSLLGQDSLGLVRTHRYIGTTPLYDTVRAHFVLPHELPTPVSDTTSVDYGKTLDLSLHIEDALTAVIAAEDTVVVGDTVQFVDVGQDGGGVQSRFWNLGEGPTDTVTATSPSRAYDTAGTKTVSLTKTHAYHGLQVADTATVVVLPPLVVGPIVGSYDGWPTNNEIEENGDCMWAVNPTGGTGSYTYVWQRRKRFWGTISGATTSELYLPDVGTSDFDLRTIISSGPLTDTTATLSMTVAFRGQVCIIRK